MEMIIPTAWSTQCLAGASVGFLSHVLYFIRGYHDTQILSILVTHITAFIALSVSFGIWTALILSSSYLISLFTSIGIYRVFFHPLSRFPGPLAAKLSRFYGPYVARNGQMHIEQNKLFKQYGDIVRTAPNELMILSSAGIPPIHASKSGCRKRNAGVYNVIHYKGEYNLDSILDREEHRWRRQVWEKAMTTKCLANYETSTRSVCNTWLRKIASSEGKPIDTSLFSLLITFDHMGKIGYSHDFGTVEAGKENRMLDLLEVMFGQIGQLGELTWPIALMKSLGVGGEAAEFDALACQMADGRLEAQGKEDKEFGDIFEQFIRDFESEKPTAFFNKNILYSDAALILVGATDTIAVVLSYAFYHLAKHPEHQEKLHEEVSAVFGKTIPGEFTQADLANLEFLEAVINETMRLDNPVCNNGNRTTPPEGIMVEGIWIPGGVSVRVPGYGLHRSERAFVRPDDFILERWTSKPEYILDRSAFFPFLVGPNNCVGKRVAMMVLRLVLSYTVQNYRFQFAPGEDGTAIYKEARNNLILKAGPLKVVFEKR
ncbi:Tryprostatin B 6-hydroxylase [Podospora aff. communis PSN243]|uniref:Tryprostatin B 6-hydroxylase n=1 Tax=Podospora aff. communis PSN243 TaxID=3040156 RepID=A0AAV9GIZ4_9PEZI|nr:Tryprostatin B 6-hydroxylase [Podospora aff. communis PSN243]